MKKMKKIAALLLSLCVFFSSVLIACAEDESVEVVAPYEEENDADYDPFAELEEYVNEEGINTDKNGVFLPEEKKNMISDMEEMSFLRSIGIDIPDVEQDNQLQRDNAAMYFAKLFGSEPISRENITYFEDVVLSNPYLEYINQGCELGYLTGTGEKQFSPERIVTPAEFVTVILRIAGYTDYVKALGGELEHYVLVAGRYDLLDNIKTKAYEPLTQRDAIIILSNAMDLPICEAVGVEKENIIYDINSDYTLLNKNFNIEKQKGVICATEDAALSGYSIVNEDAVTISTDTGKHTLNCRNVDCSFFLGQNVFYYKDNSDIVVFVEAVVKSNSIILQFDEFDISNDRRIVRYETENGNKKSVSIAYDAVFVYNGKQYDSISAEEINSVNTKIELVNVDSDNIYELVYIEHSEPLVAEELLDPIFTFGYDLVENYDYPFPMYPEELAQYNEENASYRSYVAAERTTGRSVSLDPKSNDYSVKLIMNGREIQYRDLRWNDLLSVCESRDGKKKTVYVTRNSFEDVIKVVDTENSEITTESGEVFVCSFDADDLLGKTVVLYVDVYGHVVAYRRSSTVAPVYGYLINYDSSRKGISKKWQAEIFTLDEDVVVFDFAEKFYNNDVRVTGEEFFEHFSATGHQLVKYMLDSDGNIKRIYTSTAPQGYSLNEEKPIFVMNEHYNGSDEKYGMYKDESIEMEYNLTGVKRFLVITDENGNVDESSISLASSFRTEKAPDLRVYDSRAGKIAGALVCTVKGNDVETYLGLIDDFMVVDEIWNSEYGRFIRGMRSVSRKPFLYEYYEGTPGLFDDIESGDIIKIIWYETDENNHFVIHQFQKIFTLESKGNEDTTKTICADWDYSSENMPITDGRISYNKQIYGTVFSMGSLSNNDIEHRLYSLVIQPEGTTEPEDCFVLTFTRVTNGMFPVFKYHLEEKCVEVQDGFVINPGDKVFIATNYNKSKFVVVYE